MPYMKDKPAARETPEQLRARIPGWGADRDPANRPSVPRERFDLPTGAHWDFPERQPENTPRERSIEHKFLTPVFGTTAPLGGLSGVMRRYSYAKFSEARAAHWLILLAADRVDAVESRATALLGGAPRALRTRRPGGSVTWLLAGAAGAAIVVGASALRRIRIVGRL